MRPIRNFTRQMTITLAACVLAVMMPAWGEEAPAKKTDYKTLENPQPHTKRSITRGKIMFGRYCASCHGPDGRAQIDVIADATDLTRPVMWYSGTTPGETYRSIRDGAGVAMPPFKAQIRKDEDLWHMVNFIQSLWPKDKRPALVEEKKDERATPEETSDEKEK